LIGPFRAVCAMITTPRVFISLNHSACYNWLRLNLVVSSSFYPFIKVLFTFPHGTCKLSVFSLIFNLGRGLSPLFILYYQTILLAIHLPIRIFGPYYWPITIYGFVNESAFKQKTRRPKDLRANAYYNSPTIKTVFDLDLSSSLFTRRY